MVCRAFAQESIVSELNSELQAKNYKALTSITALKATDYPAEALYDIGMAYYMQNDDDNCIIFMSMAINKDPKMAKAHYYKALSLSYIEKYLEAITSYKAAIALDPSKSEYYTSLGDVYFKIEEYKEALNQYNIAIAQKDPVDRAYTMIAQVYAAQNQMDKALQAFYTAKNTLAQSSDYYKIALYNIGVLENQAGNYDKAEAVFKEYIKLSHLDYRAHPFLMQIYYAKKEYDSAQPLRDTLYKAYAKGRLRKTLKDRFCYDQFKWKDNNIQAYEKFETPRYKGNAKLVFDVFNKEGNLVSSIQTEYNPLLVELGTDAKYELGESVGDKEHIFSKQFGDKVNYDELKQAVLDVLDGKLKPIAAN